ncbi:hypothetical protein DV735_g611, partial [Chaetothyriales sp. CBS 134920]
MAQTVVSIPAYYLNEPPLIDDLATKTSELQQETIDECLPLLQAALDLSQDPSDFNASGVPELRKSDHIAFLEGNLATFPARFVGLDASRPWMVYWALLGLHLLGEDVTQQRQRVRKTFYPLQNSTGGFGGGYGHYSHLAGTYAALLSIALVGGEDTYAMIDRKAMWHWLGILKQSDGGFQICRGGEEDVRGTLCALVIVSLLDLPLELPPDAPARSAGLSTFNDGLGDFIARCQTYEGGISASPGLEAHGAYTFCAIASLCLLGNPHATLAEHLDIPALLAWLSSRQYAPEGGFAGRTNKLHNAEGLARYILCCCQALDGGLRDKPSKGPDSYHTCYTLTGLSNTEHFHYYGDGEIESQFASAFSWQAVKANSLRVDHFEDGTDLPPLHPVFVIPHACVSASAEIGQNPGTLSLVGRTATNQTESTAREEAALIAFNICRSFSANDGMYPTGFAHDGVIQGNPVPVGSGRHATRHASRQDSRGSNSSLDQSEYHYTSDSTAAHELNQQSVDDDDQVADGDAKSVAKQRVNQQKRPWHRDNADVPPSDERPSAAPMTKGKLLTTPSRLLKLVIPLTAVTRNPDGHQDIAPLALLIHPHQPLSYLQNLLQAELPTITNAKGDSRAPSVTFRAIEANNKNIDADEDIKGDDDAPSQSYTGDGRDGNDNGKGKARFVKWSTSTELGDFIRDAARANEFEIEIEGAPDVIKVAVPSFNDRTFYLRQRLRRISGQVSGMAKIKQDCDAAALKTARRIAVSGAGVLVAYWYLVYRLTFETDLGWDAVEPCTYLVGLSTLIGGYLWFLWNDKEMSYQQALKATISRRQRRMYELRGFDLQKWDALLDEANAIRREIKAVASEYDVEWDETLDEGDKAVTIALRDERRKHGSSDKKKKKSQDEDEDLEDN